MAIQETRKKIHFVPFEIKKGRSVDTSPAPTVSLKKGALRFNKKLITELGLNGKFVKFFYDPSKKIVGFQVKTEVKLETVNKMWKLVKQNEALGTWTVNIGKMLNLIGSKEGERSYYQLPVQKYIEASDILTRGEVFYFFELTNSEEEQTNETK